MVKGNAARRKKIVVIGGGTGTFAVLSGLKKYPVDLSAVVTMADDGGSTGVLRDELGVLPPGDVRRCLVALSRSDELMRALMNHRFEKGVLRGHTLGNILLAGLEQITGSFDRAVKKAGEILRIEGRVIPVTLEDVRLVARTAGGRTVRGERNIQSANLMDVSRMFLVPVAGANPEALRAIREADAIVVGPGNLYSSLIPPFLPRGMSAAMRKTRAKKIYVANIMTTPKHTDGFSVEDLARRMESYVGAPFDYVVFNRGEASDRLVKRYARLGEHPMGPPSSRTARSARGKYVGRNFVSRDIPRFGKSDVLRARRSLIRHNPGKTAAVIMRLVDS